MGTKFILARLFSSNMNDQETKSVESIKNYLEVFSRKDSVSCSFHWQYPSSLICDSQSSVFFSTRNDCIEYYSKLFFALTLMKYKRTEIITIDAKVISSNFTCVDLQAQRVDIENKLIKKLNCIYIMHFDSIQNQYLIRTATCK